MPSRFEAPDPDDIDLDKPYDIYVNETPYRTVVYRNAFFRGNRTLQRAGNRLFDFRTDFILIEQSNGEPLYIRKYSIVKFCAPGIKLAHEEIPPAQ